MKKILLLSISLVCLIAFHAHADVVHLKDGTAVRGMVIEDYVDRIIFSTVDGEKEIMKDNVEHVEYNDPEMNLMSLGDAAFNKGRYRQAYKYYTLALEITPLDMIKKKADHAALLVQKEKEMTKRELVDKMAMLQSRTDPVVKIIPPEEKLKDKLGVILARTKKGAFQIRGMKGDSPFRKAGFKAGDRIISVWSRLTSYLTLKEISKLLLAQDQHIIHIAFERDLRLLRKTKKPLGARFTMTWEGMVVKSLEPGSIADRIGLKEKDLLIAINGESIRYTEMGKVIKLLNETKKATITIQRKATVFRLSK